MTTPPSGGRASAPDEGGSRPGWVRRALPGACIAVVALCCLALGVTAESSVHGELTRAPTAAERSAAAAAAVAGRWRAWPAPRSEEHTSALRSPCNLVCRLLLEKKKKKHHRNPRAARNMQLHVPRGAELS